MRLPLAVLFSAALLAIPVFTLPAEVDVEALLEPDAPSALFSAELGDADVDLFIDGSWRTGLGGTLGWAFHPAIPPDGRRVTFPYLFPGMQQRPYYNIVDLTISLWLYERFYFETTFIDDFELNSILLGYQGQEDEFVQSVKVGNAGLSISPYPYLSFDQALENSPGASAEFMTQHSRHELLLRYEPSATERQIFFGMNQLDERRIEPANYVRGRFFILPDGGVENLQVYIESADGSFQGDDGRLYKRANLDDEAAYSVSEGYVFLRHAAAGRVLVYYQVGAESVGDAGLGQDALIGEINRPAEEFLLNTTDRVSFQFDDIDYYGLNLSDLEVSINGTSALLLYQPGQFSPFELQNRYDVSGFNLGRDGEVEKAFIQRESFRERDINGLAITLSDERGELVVGDAGADLRAPVNRYPFAVGPQQTYPRLYGPNRSQAPGYTEFQILTRALRPVSTLSIGPGAIPGSVTVLRNGRPDNSFSVNYSTGALETSFPVAPNDVIEVSYRSYLADASGGDLLFASGNTITLSDALELKIAFGIRWNILSNTYSITPNDHPGTITFSSRLGWDYEFFQGFIDGAVQIANPDTTGVLRLLGMEDREIRIPAADFAMFPASAPDGDYPGLGGLTQANRGRLLYKDYYSEETFGGGSLQNYNASLPSSKIYPYADGSRIGPYPARAEQDGVDGNIMVLDFEMDAADEWVGAQLRVPGGRRDFSSATGLTFRWRALDLADGDIDVYLQLGAVDEDLDGDGNLDQGSSPLVPSFPFSHPGYGVLRAGTVAPGRSLVLSEDGTGNDVLDREVARLVFTSERLGSYTDGIGNNDLPLDRWRSAEIRFSSEDRRRLAEARAIRIVVLNTNGEEVAGRLLFGEFRLQGTRFAVDNRDSTDPPPDPDIPPDIVVREVFDRPPSGVRRLVDEYSEVRDVFHPETRDNQRVLQIRWGDPALDPPRWTIADYVTPVPFRQYDKLVFYLRLQELEATNGEDPKLTVRLTDQAGPGGRGLEGSILLPDPNSDPELQRWRRVELDIPARTIRLDGPDGGEWPLSVDAPRAGNDLTRLEITVENADRGTIYIDEIHWADSRISLEGTSRLALAWQVPGTVWSVRGTDIVRDLDIDHDMSVRSQGFQTESQFGASAGLFASASALRATVGATRVETDYSMAVSEETVTYSGGHSLRFPAATSPVVVMESYRRSYRTAVPSLYRSNALLLAEDELGALRFDAFARLRNQNINQTWRVRLESSWDRATSFETQFSLIHSAGSYVLSDGDDYFSSWFDGYSLLLPYQQGSGIERRTVSLSTLRFDHGTFNARVSPNWDIENQSVTRGTQRNRGNLELAFPLQFGGPGIDTWTLTPGYNRAFAFTTDAPDHGSYREDIKHYWQQTAEQRYIFASAPFYELLAPREELLFIDDSAGLSSARYDPEASLSYGRNFGSNIRDLFLPHRVRTALRRSLVRNADAITDTRTYQLEISAAAVNLFGSLGAYQTFAFYQSDEFRNTLDFRLQYREPAQTYQIDAQLISESAFFGRRNRSLAVEHVAGISAPQDTQIEVDSIVSYRWRTDPQSIFGISALQPAVERGAYYQHIERLTLGLLHFEEEQWRNELTIVIGHESGIEFPEQGSVRAYFDMGLGWKPFELDGAEQRMFILGIQAGIEGRIQF
ncbi:MAG: hypothetical protein EA404_03005 [Spirochaetaceae bacterium]|nr:MAG: hypothetical protein EA404_03005 [Spirochaetaceae bacterium]